MDPLTKCTQERGKKEEEGKRSQKKQGLGLAYM
jgi:hypothetical protein